MPSVPCPDKLVEMENVWGAPAGEGAVGVGKAELPEPAVFMPLLALSPLKSDPSP